MSYHNYDLLLQQWDRAEKLILDLGIKVETTVEVDTGYLLWVKQGQRWRIAWQEKGFSRAFPMQEVNVIVRMKCVEHIELLYQAVVKAKEDFNKEIILAADKLKAWCDR